MHEHQSLPVQEINLLFGQMGHLFVILAMVTALVAAVSYFFSTQEDKLSDTWKKIARGAFFVHALSVIGVVVLLFVMIYGHHFEYQYVWQHSSLDLDFKYILSCFWEGQEGSFLLWGFWVMLWGIFLIRFAKSWEKPVMTFLSLQQVFLFSFLLGIYVGDTKIGSTPFLLLEDALTQDPVFLFPDYMRFIADGTGLNALLQNYWMVIHPPVLFLGFASITVPFAFAMAGLWTRRYTEWIVSALPYTLFAAMILGTGILMGGAWAYEALSFGGFWAWDPVENASLIPWLVIVAALHTMVVAKATGHAQRTNFILVVLAFFFVLYASFLTRSGILGDSSVHSFVVSGLENHLLIYLFTFTLLAGWLLFRRWKHIPTKAEEEATSSREFWMFIGSLVLLFSSIHIIFFTSIPAFNHLIEWINGWLGTSMKHDFSPPVNPVRYYTDVQIWVAVIIAALTAIGQFLKYRKTSLKTFWRSLLISFFIALVLTIISVRALDYSVFIPEGVSFGLPNPLVLMLLTAYFAVFANLYYFFSVLKGKWSVSGASVSHFGFGILLLGILISNASQQVISKNTMGINYGDDFDLEFKRDNILLYKDAPVAMGQYLVTYLGDSAENRKTMYKVRYQKIDDQTGVVNQEFILYPYLLLDKKSQQLSPNPDTKHYLSYDVFTHVSSIPTAESKENKNATKQHTLEMGDTIWLSKGYLVLQNINTYRMGDTIAAGAVLAEFNGQQSATIEPLFLLIGQQTGSNPALFELADGQISFDRILPETNQFLFTTLENNVQNDWIIMKAIVFPMINLVWMGMIVLAVGFILSMRRRMKESGKLQAGL